MALCLSAFLVILSIHSFLAVQTVRVPEAAYEADYLRMDEPAYHPTLMKRAVSWIGTRNGALLSLHYHRRTLLAPRLLSMLAAVGLAVMALGRSRGALAFAVFLFLPPTGAYLIRLDSWMDSVCYSLISLYLAYQALRRSPHVSFLFFFLAGIFTGLAVDSKMTALLTLLPAYFFLFRNRPPLQALVFSAGVLAGFGVSYPEWILNPSKVLEHVRYWRAANAALPVLPVSYLVTVLISSIPASVFCLALLSFRDIGRDRVILASFVLFAVPILFFMIYRSVPPAGFRHLYLALPFISAIAASGYVSLKTPAKIGFGILCLLEMLWRHFPAF